MLHDVEMLSMNVKVVVSDNSSMTQKETSK